jgi:hypothetical protein
MGGEISANVDALLPPGADARPGEQVALPDPSRPESAQTAGEGQVLLPTDAGYVVLRDPVKTVGEGDDQVELRRADPEERARKRLRKNLILWVFGIALMGLTMLMVLFFGPLN